MHTDYLSFASALTVAVSGILALRVNIRELLEELPQPHRSELQGECLLVVGGDSSVEPDTKRFPPCPKTPLGRGLQPAVFSGS